jgi:uncharacterized phage protein (TIGR01671 family)
MSREILFRGKTIDNDQWVEGHYTEGSEDFHYITRSGGAVWLIDPTTLSQFTGLTDKNGVKIFEGCRCNYIFWIQTSPDPESLGLEYKGVGVIKFIEGCFMVVPENKANPIPLHYDDLAIEVIGNIHDKEE